MQEATPIDEDASLKSLLEGQYDLQHVTLHPFDSYMGKRIYRIEQAEGPQCVLRVSQAEEAREITHNLARVLLFLEQQDYPAERIVRTREQDIFAASADLQVLVTTFIEGEAGNYDLDTLRQYGSLLGRLHALPLPDAKEAERVLPPADMLPARELAYALSQLSEVSARVPTDLVARHDMLVAEIARVHRCEDLPVALIHNDSHLYNAMRKPGGQVTLIDWEGSGLGPAVLDLGFLLADCNLASPWHPELQLDRERIATIIAAYREHHLLTRAELERISDAIRFRSIVYGACAFAAAIREGRREYPMQTQWWWARYTAADALTELAIREFER